MAEPRFIPKGDYQECLRLRGRANQIMRILEERMRFGKLQQLSTTVDLPGGGHIICSNIFGQRTIEVSLPTVGGIEEQGKKLCLCNCNFTTGWVLSVEEEMMDGIIPLYTVMACQGKDRYVMVKHVLASDWTVYEEMQAVIMVPYYGMQFLCCTNIATATGCSKRDFTDGDIDIEEWRTSLRIVPWCGRAIPKWIYY